MSFFAELKRRNVFRVGIAYAVISWVLAQVAEFAFENFGAPDWVLKTVVVLLLLGFPLALLFAWAFEMTPEGVKREKDVDRTQSITGKTGRKLDFVIIGVLVLAVSFLLIDKFSANKETVPGEEVVVTGSQSIAVLPFVNMSDDSDHFSDGLSEELMNLLAQNVELKVAGRTSSFAFKGKTPDFQEVGAALKVEHVLEGSVRRSGDTLRVTAQLIKVDDGYHVWSNTYDRKMADIFDIQDDVASAITSALKLHLAPALDRPTDNVAAYALYLQALPYIAANDDPDVLEIVIPLLDGAIEIDPAFAKAHEAKALIYWANTGSSIESATALPLIWQSANKALVLDSSLLVAGLLANAAIVNNDAWSWNQALAAAEKAINIAPDDFDIARIYCYYLITTGYFQEALQCAERMVEIEPLSTLSHHRLASVFSALGRREDAHDSWGRAAELGGDGFYWFIVFDQMIAAEYNTAIQTLERISDTNLTYPWDPETVRLLVDSATDPQTGKAFLDAWVSEALDGASDYLDVNDVYYWYLTLGHLDDYWHAVDEVKGDSKNPLNNAEYLIETGNIYRDSKFRRHPRHIAFAKVHGLTNLWDQRGAPDFCNKDSGEWVCE